MMQRHSMRRSGQSLIEFALALPLLALLLVGLTSFGFALYANVQVANTAREAARAGSLYLGSRFHYTGCVPQPGIPCPANYGDGGDCWDFRPWVENAIVEHEREANGCDQAGFNTAIHSLGNLDPAVCGGDVTANCWQLETLRVGTETSAPGGTSDLDWITSHIGDPVEVTLLYRYQLPYLGSLLPVLGDPIDIRKTVIMRVQNN